MSPITPDIIETPQARTARLRRENAQRAREYRERQKALRAPDNRTCDAAIVEAMSCVLARHASLARAKREGTPLSEASMPIVEVLRVALEILMHAGYNREKSRVLIADRTTAREAHKDPRNVPALRPISDPARCYSPKLWPGDPIPDVVPYRREVTTVDVFRGMTIHDFLDDDDGEA